MTFSVRSSLPSRSSKNRPLSADRFGSYIEKFLRFDRVCMTILCLCREEHHWKLIPGYAQAFRRRGIDFVCVEDSLPFDAPMEEVIRRSGVTPSVIFHFESGHPLFPIGLERCEIPTVCFHPDTYAF